MRVARSAVESNPGSLASGRVSQSSVWSLEQPSGIMLADPTQAVRVSESEPQARIRDKYGVPQQQQQQQPRGSQAPPHPSAGQPLASTATLTAARGSQVATRASAMPAGEAVERGRSSAVVRGARAQGGARMGTSWLDEHNAKRVSYYEQTIFALQQAGIHCEPHWFAPVECAPRCLCLIRPSEYCHPE